MTPTFEHRRDALKLRWQSTWLLRRYRVRLPEPRYEPTGRIVNGLYRVVRRVAP